MAPQDRILLTTAEGITRHLASQLAKSRSSAEAAQRDYAAANVDEPSPSKTAKAIASAERAATVLHGAAVAAATAVAQLASLVDSIDMQRTLDAPSALGPGSV